MKANANTDAIAAEITRLNGIVADRDTALAEMESENRELRERLMSDGTWTVTLRTGDQLGLLDVHHGNRWIACARLADTP